MKEFTARFNQRQATPDSALSPSPVRYYPSCDCVAPQRPTGKILAPRLHDEIQDTQCDAWKSLEEYIRQVAANGSDELNPIAGIGPEKWEQIVTLPRSIAVLRSVKYLALYGSHLVRIPPEIGEMSNLREFDPYTSYRLHWFPYEIMRCKKLKRSRVSTRALYGNFKYRPPFPHLLSISDDLTPVSCSVCRGTFTSHGPYQAWISLRVATDVLPLLVHACSAECLQNLPKPPEGYVPKPHEGGLGVMQPLARCEALKQRIQ
jgi:hypothetical protein